MTSALHIDRLPSGQIFLPPSKSVGHRALICAALAGGGTVHNPGENEDIRATLRCLEALKNGETLLNCGESGSTLRFLIPLAALEARPITFTGQGRLMDRPLGVYEDCLGTKGVTFTRNPNTKTLTVCGPLQSGSFHLPGDVSSQFITGLLLALPLRPEDSTIYMTTPLQSASYVDLTLSVLKEYGITIHNDNHRTYHIPGNQTFRIRDFAVEADFSGAAFFLAAAALGRPLELMGLNLQSVQGDRAFLDLLEQAGYALNPGPNGGITISGPARPKPLTVDVGDIPDLVPPLAAFLAFADGESRIFNAGRLRIKESDRLATVTRQLNNLGADVTEGEDYLIIRGKERLTGGRCHGENDHRIAMMCALASIGCDGPVTLTDYACVKKSYPGFWNDFMGMDPTCPDTKEEF